MKDAHGRQILSREQLRVLQVYADGYSAGESWTQMPQEDRLAWHRHERTIDSLARRGLIADGVITEAGTRALVDHVVKR